MLGIQLYLGILKAISNLNDFMVLWYLGNEMAGKHLLRSRSGC